MSNFIIIQPHLRFGGAERQSVLLANELVKRGHRVDIILHSLGGGLVPLLDPAVQVHSINLERHVASIFVSQRIAKVLKGLPPAFVIVKLWSSILACAMIDHRVSLKKHTFNYCEDLDPSDHARYIRFGALKQSLIKFIFRRRFNLTANTNTVAESMQRVYGLGSIPVVIPSTIDSRVIRTSVSKAPEPETHAQVVSVGSLIERKGLDITLAALQLIERPLHWRIIGDGPLRHFYEAWKDPRGLLRITVERGTAEPYRLVADSKILVHSARSEAWGIVLLEALAVDVPVVAAASIGPVEMHKALGRNDQLFSLYPVGDAQALANCLTQALDREPLPEGTGARFVEPFSVATAADLWVERARTLSEVP